MIWGGRTLNADRSLNPDSCWQRLTLWNSFCRVTGLTAVFPGSGLFNAERYGGWQRDCVRAVDIVQGSLLMIRRATWETLGGFDPAFFMYGEEADLCLRARKLGADPHITPRASIIHYGAASDTVRADRMERLLAAKMGLIRRHFPPWQRPLGELLFSLWPLSRLIATRAAAAVTGKPGAARHLRDLGRGLGPARALEERLLTMPAGSGRARVKNDCIDGRPPDPRQRSWFLAGRR